MHGWFATISVNLRNWLFLYPLLIKKGIFKHTKCGLSRKGLCILRSVTRIMIKTYNCSCNRNMYLWWCSNVYRRLPSFIWRYFYCAFLGFCLGIESKCAARGGEIWLHLTGVICPWAGNLIANFWKKSNPHRMPPPHLPRRHYIDRCITRDRKRSRVVRGNREV